MNRWIPDPAALLAITLALIAVIGQWVSRYTKSSTKSEGVVETIQVDADMVQQFVNLTTRLTKVEIELAQSKAALEVALAEIKELKRLEEHLNARLHERGKEIDERQVQVDSLVRRLEGYRRRLKALEDLVRSNLGDEAMAGLPEVPDDHTG